MISINLYNKVEVKLAIHSGRTNPKRQHETEQIPPDDVYADSGFFDKKFGIHGIRDAGIGAETVIPRRRNHSGPAGKPSDNVAVPDGFRLVILNLLIQ